MRYHWIPWIKTNSTHPMASISGYIDFPQFPVLSKTFERPPLLQFLSNLLQNHQRWSSDQASQHLSNRILILTTVCPVQPLNFSRKAIKQEVKSYLSKSFRYQHQTCYVTWKTLQHVPMCKGNFISSNMIDIKQIALIANAKIMLYTFSFQKVILIQSQVHMKTLENV